MARQLFKTTIQVQELNRLIQAGQPLYLLDASYNIPGVTGNPLQEFYNRRIPGAKFFEIDTIADTTSPYPHMMPDNDTFRQHMKRLGIRKDNNPLIIYDRLGVISSPRVWFTFKTFGRENIAVLDGGLPKWIEENLPLESGDVQNVEDSDDSMYLYEKDESKVKDYNFVRALAEILPNNQSQYDFLDARSEGRVRGEVPEPRADCRPGGIQGGKNIFFKHFFNEDKTFKSPQEIRDIIQQSGVETQKIIINSCGSGLTACINILAFEIAGYENTLLYDGSWAEFGSRPLEPPSQEINEIIQKLQA